MKEERLIRALVRDLQPARSMLRAEQQVALGVLWCLGVVALFTLAGYRISHSPAALPVVVCAVLIVAAAIAAVTSSFPGRPSWSIAAFAAAAGLLIWTGEIAARMAAGVEAWGPVSWIKCHGFTSGVAVMASVGLFYLLRQGWPVRPRVTAAFTMTWAASAAALTTSLECVSNAPMHVLLGHVLPVIIVSVAGALAAPRFFPPVALDLGPGRSERL